MRLALHLDASGVVWVLGDVGPKSSGLTLPLFLSNMTPHLHKFSSFNLVGSRENVTFITELFGIVYGMHSCIAPKVRLLNPEVILPTDPIDVILVKLLSTPNQHRYWLLLTPGDVSGFLLQKKLQENEQTFSIATLHPGWPAATFPINARPENCKQLLADILHPRWFQHHNRPSRLNKLYSYLGLNGKEYAKAYLDGMYLPGERARRAFNVFNCFYTETDSAKDTPSAFLQRIFLSDHDRAKGLAKAGRSYVNLVVRCWQYALGMRHPENVFDVRDLLREDEQRALFTHYSDLQSGWRKVCGS